MILLGGIRLFFPLSAAAFDDQIPVYAEELLESVSGGDVQGWLNETLPAQIGLSAPDWYTMILSARGGYDHSAYSNALQNYLASETVSSATTRERMALAVTACEPAPPAVCTELLDQSAGEMGIMSWIFALHLVNNGVQSEKHTPASLVSELVNCQAPDGGWSLQGTFGDTDVTAMTLQALAPYQNTPEASGAIEAGVNFLADTQLSSGAYQSFGTENAESTAQVWIALSALGIDALSDTRFIADGNTLLDGILQFRTADGRFAHTFGGEVSDMATVQVYEALTAAELQQQSRNLLLFHGEAPALVTEPPAKETTAPHESSAQRTAESEASSAAQTSSGKSTTSAPAAQTTAFRTSESAANARETVSSTTAATTASVPEQIHTTEPPADPRSDTEKYPYRIPLTAAAGILFGGAAVICFVRKRRSPKTYLTLLFGFAAAAALIWLIKIESPAQFYQNEARTGGGTVTMGIRCDVICGLPGSEKFPADGEIMPLTEFAISPDENALDLLYDAVKAYGLQIEVDGVSGDSVNTAYVCGIASLYEFDFGDLSGWTYTVNGERPSVGCGACPVHDGDRIMWLYTINL